MGKVLFLTIFVRYKALWTDIKVNSRERSDNPSGNDSSIKTTVEEAH